MVARKKGKSETNSEPAQRGLGGIVAKLCGRKWAQFVVLWLAAYGILLSFFFHVLLKDHNYLEIFPQEIIFPALLHAITAFIVVAALFWLRWLGRFAEKLVSVVVMTLLLFRYDEGLQAVADPIRAFTPLTNNDPMPFVSLLYLLLLFGVAVGAGIGYRLLARRIPSLRPENMQLGVLVLVAYLFVLPAYSVATVLPSMIRQASVQPSRLPAPTQPAAQEKPDIYYIVLDRYTNDTVLREQFNYDNSQFAGHLKANDFFVNDNGFGNYPYTALSISSTLNADYTKKIVAPYKNERIQSRTLYHSLTQQSSVVQALKKAGYSYHALGSPYGATYKAPLADHDYMFEHELSLFGKTKRLRGIEGPAFQQSLLYHFAQIGASWWPLKITERDRIASVRDQLNFLNGIATSQQFGGRFIFAHMLMPHNPFNFNADGSFSAYPEPNDNLGKPIKQKYTDQLTFINTQMQALIDNIQKQSGGKAVIILNSDEGPHPRAMNATFLQPVGKSDEELEGSSDMTKWPEKWLHMKFGSQQAAHIPDATPEDLEHLSSVNVFRIVLNRYLGYELPYLPNCQFGLYRGSYYEFNYKDITGAFTDNPPAACQELESVPSH